MKGAYTIIIAIFVMLDSSVAVAQRRAPGRHALVRSASADVEQRRRSISPAMARTLAPIVFGATRRVRVPVVERHTFWVEPRDADVKKPFRPRVMPDVMGFPTGGGGVGLKLRY